MVLRIALIIFYDILFLTNLYYHTLSHLLTHIVRRFKFCGKDGAYIREFNETMSCFDFELG